MHRVPADIQAGSPQAGISVIVKGSSPHNRILLVFHFLYAVMQACPLLVARGKPLQTVENVADQPGHRAKAAVLMRNARYIIQMRNGTRALTRFR